MKKVVILGLHLGYGGVEQAIINEANMLSNDYDVEVVSIYKVMDFIPFKVQKNVKITYLTDLKPNREEFMNYLRKGRLFKTFKEGLKSLKILYYKKKCMQNYLQTCKADIIISSRIEITELLNKANLNNQLKIAIEHRHHNNEQKYIERLRKSLKNINYLVVVSKDLQKYYEKNFQFIRCFYIPNALEYSLGSRTNLKAKRLIAIGRLSVEKGFVDLIDVFNLVSQKDKDVTLDIIGDGVERDKILKKILEYKLQDKIKLHGFQKKDYINKYLKESSICLMTSLEESFGTVLIEASSFGVPQIAFTSAQGACEIIKNGKSGYLIEDRNKEEMANKILELLNDKQKLQEFSNNAYEEAKNYTFPVIKQKWLDFLGEIDE